MPMRSTGARGRQIIQITGRSPIPYSGTEVIVVPFSRMSRLSTPNDPTLTETRTCGVWGAERGGLRSQMCHPDCRGTRRSDPTPRPDLISPLESRCGLPRPLLCTSLLYPGILIGIMLFIWLQNQISKEPDQTQQYLAEWVISNPRPEHVYWHKLGADIHQRLRVQIQGLGPPQSIMGATPDGANKHCLLPHKNNDHQNAARLLEDGEVVLLWG